MSRIVPAACFLFLTIANLVWIARDNRPPFWDMAYHQTAAIRIVNAFSESGVAAIKQVPALTGYYPPVYHSIVAVFYGFFGISPRVGQIANIPAAFILIFATFGLARAVVRDEAACAAAALVTFFPIMVWLSRAAMIDYWLSALVALGMWLLYRSDGFSNRRMSILFGLVCGLGLLTKASFAAFVGLPALWNARSNWKNAAVAASIAIALAAVWYVPQWNTFMAFYAFNSASGVAEGDPARLSWQSALFYVRAMEGYQLFLPLWVLFGLGAVRLTRDFNAQWMPVVLWIVGGWMGLLLLENKDPRYSMPLLPAIAIVTAKLFERRTLWLAALVPFLLFQHFLISFGVSWLPDEMVIARGPDARPTWNWNLYTQSYAGLWGRPIMADWRVDDVIDRATAQATFRTAKTIFAPDPEASKSRLGLVPDIPSFDLQAFEFEIARRRAPVIVKRVSIGDTASIEDTDYVLVTSADESRFKGVHSGSRKRFARVDSFELPGGAIIGMYRATE